MSRSSSWIFLLLLSSHGPVFGQTSCLPAHVALQAFELIDPGQPTAFKYHLKDLRAGTVAETRVYLQGEPDTDDPHLIRLSVAFDRDFEGVSLPYNLYSLLIVRDGEVVGWWDFTRACRGSGLSFFPGREIELPVLKLIGEKPQKLQIMVWGKL